jgi:hypothetical protein
LDEIALFRQPAHGVNPIAWTVGHLVYSFQAIGEELDIPHWLGSDWIDLFGQGSRLRPDKEQYPGKAALLESLRDGKRRVLERLERMSEQEMSGPLPDERYRHIFPTLGHAVLNTLVSHFAFHYGHICAVAKMVSPPNPGIDRTEAGHG